MHSILIYIIYFYTILTIPTGPSGARENDIDEGAFPKAYKPCEILGTIVVVGYFCNDKLAKAVTMIQYRVARTLPDSCSCM